MTLRIIVDDWRADEFENVLLSAIGILDRPKTLHTDTQTHKTPRRKHKNSPATAVRRVNCLRLRS